MSIEHTPPHDGETTKPCRTLLSADFDRVHSSAKSSNLPLNNRKRHTARRRQLRDKLTELTVLFERAHPADVAAVLESLPPRERNIVRIPGQPEDDGEVLLEVSDAVRETLIESMDKDERWRRSMISGRGRIGGAGRRFAAIRN